MGRATLLKASAALATAWIQGLQSGGVGASLKHFALNNQERRRMTIDVIVESRALRELYLASFETAVRDGQPASVMCAYNQVNGTPCSEHSFLINQVLRREWAFGGFVVTDWGANRDRVRGLLAGIDLEMPEGGSATTGRIIAAVETGQLSETVLDASVDRLLSAVLAYAKPATPPPSPSATPGTPAARLARDQLARRIAVESTVLLKNENRILPLDPTRPVTVIGGLAATPRYQGAGSSFLAPANPQSFLDGLEAARIVYHYAAGYPTNDDAADPFLAAEAVALAQVAAAAGETIVYYLGLTDQYESEGFDRTHLQLPANQTALLAQIAAATRPVTRAANSDKAPPAIIAVFVGGAPVETPWLDSVQALLAGYLGGQASGAAQADLLFGFANPSGRLAETWPLRLEDTPGHGNFPGSDHQVLYKEGLFIGYRYYASAGRVVRFAFGHGLSYSDFRFERLELSADTLPTSGELQATVSVRNAGERAGQAVVQVYVSYDDSAIERPTLALAGFAKGWLEPSASASLSVTVSPLALRHWDESAGRFCLESGRVTIKAGASSADLPLAQSLNVPGDGPASASLRAAPRLNLRQPPAALSDADFAARLGRPLPPPPSGLYNGESTLADVSRRSGLAALVQRIIVKTIVEGSGAAADSPNSRMMRKMAREMPLTRFIALSGGLFNERMVQALVDLGNRRRWRGFFGLIGALLTMRRRRR